ncbi:MAG: sn-glycerol-3-phosphate ABC transporter permease UgpA [Geminicoccaceae bacterium]|nr:sn-glycerol-3-phosphate ABC transporter permease UgpA [Geminicoccaceae bacterium]MCX8102590.1 sn-glycerol-3-phosphate ABC transporter permease UgpA [Geminicoccaceae bacterium]MDW8370914.1 sn-glycerol-3-phosphate ABC transporter permease UgpA [Geminicoccaceae bacterium]
MIKRVTFRGRLLPWLLLAPQLLVLLFFFFWPAGQAIVQALFMVEPFSGELQWVGLLNFEQLLASPAYRRSILVTILFCAATAGLAMLVGLFLAVLVDRTVRGRTVYRTFAIWPYAVAPAIAGALFLFLLDPAIGVLAFALRRGLGWPWDPHLDASHAMVLVVLAAAWKQVAYNFVFFLAGLQAIPRVLIEAAALDGAGPWQRLLRVTLPLLSPTAFFLLVMNLVYAFFDTFGIVATTTEGGPAGATRILVYKVWEDGFVGLDLGSSAAQSVILMAIVVSLTVLQFRFLEKRVHYAG